MATVLYMDVRFPSGKYRPVKGPVPLVMFVVPVGDYTLRVYEINRGGPPLLFVDEKITVTPDAEIRLEVVDCLPCV